MFSEYRLEYHCYAIQQRRGGNLRQNVEVAVGSVMEPAKCAYLPRKRVPRQPERYVAVPASRRGGGDFVQGKEPLKDSVRRKGRKGDADDETNLVRMEEPSNAEDEPQLDPEERLGEPLLSPARAKELLHKRVRVCC
jgi:hypothetical protein